MDGIRYHGKSLTILFDRDGTRYGRGKGLRAFLDGSYVPPAESETAALFIR